MKEHISLGPVPADEPAAQVGTDGYELMARSECRRHIEMLRAFYNENRGELPEGLTLRIKTNHHDFGDYLDVIVEFDGDDERAATAALWLDNHRPGEWPV